MLIHRYTSKLGVGYTIMSLINSGCLIITLVLLLCYSFSSDTYSRVRPSLLVKFKLELIEINNI